MSVANDGLGRQRHRLALYGQLGLTIDLQRATVSDCFSTRHPRNAIDFVDFIWSECRPFQGSLSASRIHISGCRRWLAWESVRQATVLGVINKIAGPLWHSHWRASEGCLGELL